VVRALLRILKGVYDLLASYLMAWVLLLALLALVFQLLLGLGVGLFEFQSTESFWTWVDRVSPVPSLGLRLVIFGSLHLAAVLLLRRHLRRLGATLERAADRALARYRRWARSHPRGRRVAGALFSIGVTLLLIPFVVQPTLVAPSLGARRWAERAANLVDGSASAALIESVVGLYRKLYARPAMAGGVTEAEFDASFGRTSRRPLMDRWDQAILRAADGDRRAFAQLKAFMWVESAGEQYAVSHTGCVGLMQFCSRTARSGPFRAIFGVGQVYPCQCNGRCRVSRPARLDLESGDPRRVERQRDAFPCDLTDARFDPHKSIAAGLRFIQDLDREFHGNLAVMYIGYNSGPTVARRLWAALGRRADADLATIGRHLAAALRPYGDAAGARARALSRVHLPKLLRAHRIYSQSPP
jgi:soluble lytic murein transglycosylase-like protein